MEGWIKIHRQLVNWEWYSDINTKVMFLHLLFTVNHEAKKWRGLTINPGQIITSISGLAQQTGLTVQNVRTSIDKLKSTNELTIKTTNKYTLLTITCWDKYQTTNKQTNKQLTNDQQTTNKRLTTTKECKNEKNEKNEEKIYKKEKISLDELSVEHISEWLNGKRQQGIYINHDEHEILESFKNYCKAKGKKYADYRAGYQNAFKWQQNQPNGGHNTNGKFTSTNQYGNKKPSTTENMLTAFAEAAFE